MGIRFSRTLNLQTGRAVVFAYDLHLVHMHLAHLPRTTSLEYRLDLRIWCRTVLYTFPSRQNTNRQTDIDTTQP